MKRKHGRIQSFFQDLPTLLQEKRKISHTTANEKRKTEKSWNVFYLQVIL